MACVNGRKKDNQRGRNRRAARTSRVVLDRLSKLGAQYWSPADCMKTLHFEERRRRRGITYQEFLDTWRLGEWLPDPNDPAGFTAARGRCQIVVLFKDETPCLITAKYVADFLSV